MKNELGCGLLTSRQTRRAPRIVCVLVGTLATVCILVVLWPTSWAAGGSTQLGVTFVRYTTGTDPVRAVSVVKAVFVVSNSTHRPIIGKAGPTEIYTTNGVWEPGFMYWYPPPLRPDLRLVGKPVVDGLAWFDLQPGRTTNVQVIIAPSGPYRLPFAWGYPSLTPAEQLQRRIGKFVEFRKKYGRWDGWRRTGSLLCRTSVWENVTPADAEPGPAPRDGPKTPSGNPESPAQARHRSAP